MKFAKVCKKNFFICAIDFDGVFDRISRNILIKKLTLFGAGSTFIMCIAAMDKSTESIIIQMDNHSLYTMSGIKQGLPLSPYLFLFYINDIFDYVYSICPTNRDLLDKLHLLTHADDANISSSSRENMVLKIKSVLSYCTLNKIQMQLSKCKFIVINVSDDDKNDFITDIGPISTVNQLIILGSPLTYTGILKDDLDAHLKERFKNIIKYFNFIRSNKTAPISIKLKVLSSCVLSTILYNCETFGDMLPDGIEKLYHKLIRSAHNVRHNTPSELILIESGLLPLKALVAKRQLKFFRKFEISIRNNSIRHSVFNELLQVENRTSYLNHYLSLDEKYVNPNDIYAEAMDKLKTVIHNKSSSDKNYRYYIYTVKLILSCYHPHTFHVLTMLMRSHVFN